MEVADFFLFLPAKRKTFRPSSFSMWRKYVGNSPENTKLYVYIYNITSLKKRGNFEIFAQKKIIHYINWPLSIPFLSLVILHFTRTPLKNKLCKKNCRYSVIGDLRRWLQNKSVKILHHLGDYCLIFLSVFFIIL